MIFLSDNAAGIAPDILHNLSAANAGFAKGYGDDDLSRRLERRFSELFEREVAVFLVSTGTAANALSLAHITPFWGGVLCHERAHIMTSECGATEFLGAGLKLYGVPGENGKIAPEALEVAARRYSGQRSHQVVAASLSLTNVTEAGTVYRVAEIERLTGIAHAHGLKVHMDGARFANAVAALNASPAQATWKAGVDVLSFGATKGGALGAEAIVFFNRDDAARMSERRKRAGHLLSKHRFAAAQLETYITNDYWLKLARHANGLAGDLAKGLTAAGITPIWPVEANLIFAALPRTLHAKLEAAGARYYAGYDDLLPAGYSAQDYTGVRLVTSFATTGEDVAKFLAQVQKR